MRIEHIAIWARDIDSLCTFYTRYFSAKSGEKYHNPAKGFTSRFLTFDDGARLELMHRDGLASAPSSPHSGLAHVAISVGSKEAVDSLTAQIKADGWEIIGPPRTTGDGYYESVIADPEGNLIELTI